MTFAEKNFRSLIFHQHKFPGGTAENQYKQSFSYHFHFLAYRWPPSEGFMHVLFVDYNITCITYIIIIGDNIVALENS